MPPNIPLCGFDHSAKSAVLTSCGLHSSAASPRSISGPLGVSCASRAYALQSFRLATVTQAQSRAGFTSSAAAHKLLDWIADLPGALQPAVMVDTSLSTAGRRLRARRHLAADEPVMAMPMTSVFADCEVWSTIHAEGLLLPLWKLAGCILSCSVLFSTLSCLPRRQTMTHTYPGAPAWHCVCCNSRHHVVDLTLMKML